MEELIMKVNGRNKVLRDFVNNIENATAYETVNVSTNEVRKKCVKCGRIRIFYCKDENFKFCDNCGRKIITEHLDPCRHCLHFDEETFKCDKIHHCDCDCPECSPESYI